jgi:hypothetical protein
MSGFAEITSRTKFQEEDVLPIEVIREHSKTDDTPMVTDNQLELYRKFAFEQAEIYTNRIILGHANVIERFRIDASNERDSLRPRKARKLTLTYMPIEKRIIIGDARGGNKAYVDLRENRRKVEIPASCFSVDIGNCCSGNGLNYDAMTQYTTGYRNKEDIPSTILYGCLKVITWAIANPGDELLTVRNRLGTTETGLIGTNNGAWASGAIEHWRTYKVE